MIRERSLRANSISSLVASAGVFAITLALSAVLARSIVAEEYRTYATATAFLPLALILSQSLRSCAGSGLIIALQRANSGDVADAYRRVVLSVTSLTIVAGSGLIEGVRFLNLVDHFDTGLLPFGLYCILINVTGIGLSLIVTGPAAASEDFQPDNLLKLVPQALMLCSFMVILGAAPPDPLWWIFFAVAAAPWPLTAWLLLRYRKAVARWFDARKQIDSPSMNAPGRNGTMQFLVKSLASVVWWNMTAYFATSVTIAVVALMLPGDVVAFTMAFSLIGVLSGGLIAISAPIASRVAVIPLGDPSVRLRAFRRFNCYYFAYILAVAVFIVVVPARVYELWVGTDYGSAVRSALLLLLPATVLRLQTMCFTLFVMSVGRQSTLWLSPMAEAVVASSASFVLAPLLGLGGVALALALSASVRIVLTLTHDIRLNHDLLPIEWRDLLFPVRATI